MLSRASCVAARTAACAAARRNLSAVPVRKEVSKAERGQLRAARRERAAAFLQSQAGGGTATAAAAAGGEAGAASATAAKGASSSSGGGLMLGPRVVYGVGLGLPTILLFWGIYDEDSPPAKFSRAIGLTSKISSVTDEFARPAREKLIPDWSQVRQMRSVDLSFAVCAFYSPGTMYLLFIILLVDAQCTARYSRPSYSRTGFREHAGQLDVGP